MKTSLLFLTLALLAQNLTAQETATGFVFEDSNKNGKKDRSEKGIPQVPVSNGKDFTLTDASGKYQLPVGNDNIIFAVKPAGYKMPTDEFNIPRFYYIHKPAGSPETKYKGVAPTGKLPKSIDFPLYKYDEPENFSALIFGDTQPHNEKELEYLARGIFAEAAETGKDALFGITLGDLVGDNLDLHIPYKKAISKTGLPWYNVMGNHDRNYDTTEDALSDESFEASFGPNNYSFNYGKAHFIVLDDIFSLEKGGKYTGGVRDDQLEFLANDLKLVPAERLIVLSVHIPLTDVEKGAFREADRQKIYALLEKYQRVLVFSAHTHFQCQNFAGNIHEHNVGATCGDWQSGAINPQGLPIATMRDGTPPGYAFLNVTGNNYTLDYKVRAQPSDYRISVYNPRAVRANASTTASIYANVFMGSPSDLVEYRIDDGKWTKMQITEEFDPAYLHYVQEWDYFDTLPPGRRPSNPIICKHLWKGRIPTDLPAGNHSIEIRTKDMFGRIFSQTASYRIE